MLKNFIQELFSPVQLILALGFRYTFPQFVAVLRSGGLIFWMRIQRSQ